MLKGFSQDRPRISARLFSSVAALACLAAANSASAQDAPESGDAPAPDATTVAGPQPGTGAQVYTPADFARYAPRNALDMLAQVPGFNIQGSEQRRGLGQATGNVLFNGQRPSNKSEDIGTLLQRIPAGNVERIEIVDGATLEIPGLSGQVANVVYRANDLSGQFSWSPQFRTNYTDPLLTSGSVSVSGRSGTVAYGLALNNENAGRSGAGGPTLIFDADDNVIETRDEFFTSNFDSPRLSGNVNWDPVGSVEANFNAQYQRIFERYGEDSLRSVTGQPDLLRTVRSREDSWNYELGGDIAFDLGPGRLKTIALRRFNHEPFEQTVITEIAGSDIRFGDRFARTGDLSEWIGRGEYTWQMLGGDWQASAEAAYNSLDNVGTLFTLDPVSNEFVEVPFPGGSGGVDEDRYDGALSYSRPLGSGFAMQVIAGAEYSTLSQSGPDGLTRSFFRPKGSLNLSYRPGNGWDASATLSRRVSQLSFYDFLARADLGDNNENVGNNDLRPQQDWSFEGEVGRSLGAWGSTRLSLIYRDVEDRVEIVPIPGGGESVGNVDSSWAAAVVSQTTFNFDPVGIRGLRLDGTFVLQTSELTDPFTGETRQWSGFPTRQANLNLRHDIPESDWAWSVGANHTYVQPRYRSNQVDRSWEGPWFVSARVENKDVLGMTVSAGVANIFGARSYRDRTVYDGLRSEEPVLFREERDRLIGPIFTFSVRGDF